MAERIQARSLRERCTRLLDATPLKLMIMVVVIGLATREWFPFSRFGMYSNPGKQDFYIYVTDGDDEIIVARKVSHLSVSRLKKVFNSHVAAVLEELDEPGLNKRDPRVMGIAGERTLSQLIEAQRDASDEQKREIELLHVKLWRVDLGFDDDDQFTRTTALIAEVGGP